MLERVCVYVYGHASVCVHYRAVQWDVNAGGGGERGHYLQMSYRGVKYPSD